MRQFLKKRMWTIVIAVLIVVLIAVLIYILPYLIVEIPPERSEWAYEDVQVTKLNDRGLYGKGVTVGIIDTGIDLSHPELEHVDLIAWRDLINREAEPYDDDGHGTAMAGIIAGSSFGVAPDVSLIVVKAIDPLTGATDTNIYTAIRFCIQEGADIISMSLGRDEMRIEHLTSPWNDDNNLKRVCDEATEKGIFLVAAAGNDGGENDDGEVSVPGVHDKTITVGAVDSDMNIASFSSEGNNDGKVPNILQKTWDPWERHDPDKKPELVGPGVGIVAPTLKGKYSKLDGTSLAVPFVSGGLALIIGDLTQYQHENNSGEADVDKVKNTLMSTSKKLSNQERPHDDNYGYGLFQAYELYKALKE